MQECFQEMLIAVLPTPVVQGLPPRLCSEAGATFTLGLVKIIYQECQKVELRPWEVHFYLHV